MLPGPFEQGAALFDASSSRSSRSTKAGFKRSTSRGVSCPETVTASSRVVSVEFTAMIRDFRVTCWRWADVRRAALGAVDEPWYDHAPGSRLAGGASGADKREPIRMEVAIGKPDA
jgi:hypothetical protein